MRSLFVVLFIVLFSSGLMAQKMNNILSDMEDESWQAAYDQLETLMRKKPKNTEAKFFAGICLAELYRPDESIQLFKASADLAQDIPFYYVKFAKAYLLAGQVQNAKNTLAQFDSKDMFDEDKKEYNQVRTNILAAEKYLPNPKDLIVQNLGTNVNTDGSEYSPLMTSDHRGIFFTARRKKESEKARDGEAYEQVMTSDMDEVDDWTKDAVLDGYAKGTDHDATVQLMNGDSTLVSFKNEDLFISDLQADGNWGNRRSISNINTSKWESHVYFFNNGKSMIYASAANTKGDLDLYMMHQDASGKWGKGQAIEELNTPYNDDSPYVAEDGTFFFASRGHESMGGYDIFQSTYDSAAGKFSEPLNLGAPINSVNDDTFFSVFGKMAYFSSYRPGGFGSMDIYKVYLFNKTVVAGRLLNCGDRSPVVGAVLSVEGKETEFTATTDENGFYSMELPIEQDIMLNIVKAGNNIYKQKHYVKVLFRDENEVGRDFLVGCPDQSESDERIIIKLKNGFDLNPSEIVVEPPVVAEEVPEVVTPEPEVVEEEAAEEVVAEENPVVEEKKVVEEVKAADTPPADISTQTMLALDEIELPIVYFDFDKHNIKSEFFERLDKAARLLRERPDVRVFVGGHTDNYGTNEYNVALGERRYNEVHAYLLNKGVNPEQLETGTYGEDIPAVNNRTRRGRALNRRVMLSFIQ